MQGKIEKYILQELDRKKGLLFALIDPLDYKSPQEAVKTAKNADEADADIILIGGSTGVQGEDLDSITKVIKENVSKPVVLFPGNIGTLTKYADAVYFMSMLNSRNTYWISEAQMLAAPMVRRYGIEPLPVAYVVVDPGGTVGWVGDAKRLPRSKPKIAAAFAMAAEYMGFRFFVTDAGSNPTEGHVPLEMISAVKASITIPYIAAGGIRTPDQAKAVIKAGADIIQVGTAFEKESSVSKIKDMVKAVREGAKNR
ncbi:MAG: geranylgeranylglyceryl/heptaprenylglyceryl phosphate synthase [Candidatus ainarchaeum sp.]|nr:geranylgeranylglyceryl/heptaprenylglyceryl phosphate synthase [Candidatus ainarchaeum sp.]